MRCALRHAVMSRGFVITLKQANENWHLPLFFKSVAKMKRIVNSL